MRVVCCAHRLYRWDLLRKTGVRSISKMVSKTTPKVMLLRASITAVSPQAEVNLLVLLNMAMLLLLAGKREQVILLMVVLARRVLAQSNIINNIRISISNIIMLVVDINMRVVRLLFSNIITNSIVLTNS